MAITPPGAGTFTTITFVLIALATLLTLLVIVVGVRRSRRRRAGERQVRDEAAEVGIPTAAPPPPPEPRDAQPPGIALDRAAFAPEFAARPVPDTERPVDEVPPDRPIADERIVAPMPLSSGPVVTADPAPAQSAADSPADGPVLQLKGLGPKVATRLGELGIATVGQIAALDADQANALDGQLGPFMGRLHRDRWVEQARFLAAGDRAGFEAVFGRL